MKAGKSLQELARTLERNAEAKVDMVADTRDIVMQPETTTLALQGSEYEPSDHCHNQIAAWSGIGRRYYRKMLEDSPALLAGNVNHWLHKDGDAPTRRMVRTLDGNARAFLSDHFLRLDNEHVAEATFKALEAISSELTVLSTEVTDRRLYLKFAFPRTELAVSVGDAVQSGVIVRNSETGLGSFEVYPFVYRLICENGMVRMVKSGDGYRRTHRGSRIKTDGVVYQQDTIEAAAQAALLECRDAVTTFADPEYFEKSVETFREAANTRPAERPARAVETLAKSKGFDFTEGEQESILESFIRGGDYSKWGMLNAVTNIANKVDDYDRASELEVLGGKVLDLNPTQWETIAVAA